MITRVSGDLFQSPARVLVNPVNTVGVMGAGLARDFKRFYPDMFEQYRSLCHADAFDVGKLWLYRTSHKWVLNFPTKKHWRAGSRLEYLEAGLTKFAATFAEKGITSVSFPRLGSGQGGLDWETEVRPLMEAYLGPLPISIYLHDDPENNRFAPERRNARAIRSWLVGQPQIVTFAKFWRDLTRMMDKHEQFASLDGDSINFRVGKDTSSRRRQGRNLVILHPGPQPLFVSESLLVDLWTYIRGAGYILPQNLPGGLDERAPYIIALLAGLDYLRPVHLAVVDSEPVVGLHYVPPVEKEEKSLAVTLKAKG